MPRLWPGLIAALVLAAHPAPAQAPDIVPPVMRPALKLGEPVRVFLDSVLAEGPFDGWRGDSVTVLMPRGALALSLAEVRRIDARRRQPVLAFGIGALVGGAGSALSIWLTNALNDAGNCGVLCRREEDASRTILINALIGAGLALAYDTFAPGFRTVYRRSSATR